MVGTSAFSSIASARFVERLGVGIAALAGVKLGEIGERRRDLGMVGTERLVAESPGARLASGSASA